MVRSCKASGVPQLGTCTVMLLLRHRQAELVLLTLRVPRGRRIPRRARSRFGPGFRLVLEIFLEDVKLRLLWIHEQFFFLFFNKSLLRYSGFVPTLLIFKG